MTRTRWKPLAAAALLAVVVLTGASTLINLQEQVTGVLPVANGGTGNATGQPTAAFFEKQITSAVTLGSSSYTASSGTFPAVTTAGAGTWLVEASLDLQTTSVSSGVNLSCEIFDGTAVVASGYASIGSTSSSAVKNFQMSLHGTAVEAGAVTFTARCTSTTSAQLMEPAAANNSGGNNASTIVAVRIQ